MPGMNRKYQNRNSGVQKKINIFETKNNSAKISQTYIFVSVILHKERYRRQLFEFCRLMINGKKNVSRLNRELRQTDTTNLA